MHGVQFCFKGSLSNAVFFTLLAYLSLCNKNAFLLRNTIDIQLNVSELV